MWLRRVLATWQVTGRPSFHNLEKKHEVAEATIKETQMLGRKRTFMGTFIRVAAVAMLLLPLKPGISGAQSAATSTAPPLPPPYLKGVPRSGTAGHFRSGAQPCEHPPASH